MKRIILTLLLVTWQANLLSSIPLYFCTAANSRYFPHLVHLIGSIHATNFDHLAEIAIFDLGLTTQQKDFLNTIQKISIYAIEKTNPDMFKEFNTGGRTVPGWYSWKPVCIKQALDMFPYILWIDAGTTVLKPLDPLFYYIAVNGYFLCTMGDEQHQDGKFVHDVRWCSTQHIIKTFNLDAPENQWILDQEVTMGGIIGACRQSSFYNEFVLPIYQMTFDIKNFQDDGTTPNGFGTGRHDQPIYSALSRLKGMHIFVQDATQQIPMMLTIADHTFPFYVTWNPKFVSEKTSLFSSRRYILNFTQHIKYK